MCIIHCGMALCHLRWYLENQAIDYMSQYVDWTATPVSMWIYGNVWECEWKWCVDKVVVISVSIIRLVHTQMILVAAPASDRYRRDSLRRMCFVACLSRKKHLSRQKWHLYSSPPMKPVMPIHLQSVKRLSPKTDGFVVSSHWKLDGLLCVRVIVSQWGFPRLLLFFSEIWNTRSLAGYGKTDTIRVSYIV